jgi:hypothetical protein
MVRHDWPYFGLTTTLNAAAYCASTSTVLAGQRRNAQVAGTRDTVYGSEGREFESPRMPRDGAARSADELVKGVLVGGGVPEFHHLAVAQVKDVRLVDRDAPAAPAGRGGHQRDTVLVIGKDRVKVQAE